MPEVDLTQATETFPLAEHVRTWWGVQACMDCNPERVPLSRPTGFLPRCGSCDGSGWTLYASIPREPWSEIIPGLSIGGHDFTNERGVVESYFPKPLADLVVDMYSRIGFGPGKGSEHRRVLVADSNYLSENDLARLAGAAELVARRVQEGKTALTRCQAGLNRSSLVAGMAMILLGFGGADAIQLIRLRRSPWALCNPYFESLLRELSVDEISLLSKQVSDSE